MKRLLFVFLIALPALSFAAFDDSILLGVSSYTTTNETARLIQNAGPGNVLWAVTIGSASVGGTLTIFDSSGTVTSTMTSVSLGTLGTYQYQVRVSSGITYTTTGNTSGVNIIWKRTRVYP